MQVATITVVLTTTSFIGWGGGKRVSIGIEATEINPIIDEVCWDWHIISIFMGLIAS